VRGEWLSVRVSSLDERGVARHEPSRPRDVTHPDGVEHVLDLDREQSTELAKVMNRPTGRRRAIGCVARVQLGARVDEGRYERAMAVECRVMQRGRPISIAGARQLRMRSQEGGCALDITGFNGLEEPRGVAQAAISRASARARRTTRVRCFPRRRCGGS